MGMSTHVTGFKPPDEEWEELARTGSITFRQWYGCAVEQLENALMANCRPYPKCGMRSHHSDCDCGGAGGDR